MVGVIVVWQDDDDYDDELSFSSTGIVAALLRRCREMGR